jgi:D-alanine-D-alanine ligase
MELRKIAIVCGGDSSEVEVSLKSARGLNTFINHDHYQVWIVVIQSGNWYVRLDEKRVAPIDKNDFSFIQDGRRIRFDFAWITIHGTPGEDGRLQGYFDLIGLPYSCCGVLSAAITFNKFICNQFLKGFGVLVAESILLRKGQSVTDEQVVEAVGLPCFVKCNVGGSSFGVTKVKQADQIQKAIERAFAEGPEVIIEAFMSGTEVTCGCYKTHQSTHLLPVTEVVSENEFFDYDAKYKGQVQEITPARIPDETRDRIQSITSHLYDILGCKGIIRADYIITEKGIHLLEVNTTPGMTATSFIPQQVASADMDMGEVMAEIIEDSFIK